MPWATALTGLPGYTARRHALAGCTDGCLIRHAEAVQDQWGWNPSTFEAIGTVAAATLAAVALLLAVADRRSEARRARQAQAQPILVFEHGSGRRGDPLEVVVHNRGGTDVMVSAFTLRYRARSFWNRKRPRNCHDVITEPPDPQYEGYRSSLLPLDLWGYASYDWRARPHLRGPEVVAPGDSTSMTIRLGPCAPPWGERKNTFGVMFADGDGNVWTRTIGGRLRPGNQFLL